MGRPRKSSWVKAVLLGTMSQPALQNWLYRGSTITASALLTVRGNPTDATCNCGPSPCVSCVSLQSAKISLEMWPLLPPGPGAGERVRARERENGKMEAPPRAHLLALVTSQWKFRTGDSDCWFWGHKPVLYMQERLEVWALTSVLVLC